MGFLLNCHQKPGFPRGHLVPHYCLTGEDWGEQECSQISTAGDPTCFSPSWEVPPHVPSQAFSRALGWIMGFTLPSPPFLSYKSPASMWPIPDRTGSGVGRQRGAGDTSSSLGCWMNSPSSSPIPIPKMPKKPKENENSVSSHKPIASSPDWLLGL